MYLTRAQQIEEEFQELRRRILLRREILQDIARVLATIENNEPRRELLATLWKEYHLIVEPTKENT